MSKEAIYTEIYLSQSPTVDTLFKIYEKSKYNARVYFMNENSMVFSKDRVGIFDEPNGDFTIVHFNRKYGISKTNIIYSRESRVFSIIKKGNKFYLRNKFGIKPLTYGLLSSSNFFNIMEIELVKRLPWIKYLGEHNVLFSTSFNTIYSKKIFSLDKALRYQYKVPVPTAKILHSLTKEGNHMVGYLRHYIEYLDNVENLSNTLPNYNFDLFYDTVKMGKILDKRVNCSWSPKRLKEEHDNWSRLINDIVFVDGDRLLSISPIYVKFAEQSGFKILGTTKEMAYEGKANDHCVGTYIGRVESGSCAIYHINGYTLELRKDWNTNAGDGNGLVINQFKGYRNCNAPEELYNLVNSELLVFNKVKREEEVEELDFGIPF